MAYHVLHPNTKPSKPAPQQPPKATKVGVSSALIAKVLAEQSGTQPGKTS